MLELAGVTVPVTDMRASARFYTRLLDRAPVVEDPAYTLFERGAQLGLLAVTDPVVQAGSRPQPLLRTDDLDRERARISAFAREVGRIQDAQGYRLVLFGDPDGNALELYEA